MFLLSIGEQKNREHEKKIKAFLPGVDMKNMSENNQNLKGENLMA
jgi:hypothetical protein